MRAWACYDDGAGPFSEALVRVSHDRGVGDIGVFEQEALHLGHRDVLAATDDDVLAAAAKRQPAAVVNSGRVPRSEPQTGQE